MAATSMLRLIDVRELAAPDSDGTRNQLMQALLRLEGYVRVFSESITHRYLVHATPRRRLGDIPESSENRV